MFTVSYQEREKKGGEGVERDLQIGGFSHDHHIAKDVLLRYMILWNPL